MDVTRRRSRIAFVLVAGALIGCEADSPVDQLPKTAEVLQAIGRRLSAVCSENELDVLASRCDLLLRRLNRSERAGLSRGYLRFRVDSPVSVNVAVPAKSVPFWIADQGFRLSNLSLQNDDALWVVYRKTFEPGWIGLGVNGLDRQPVAHYVVFVRPLNTPKPGGRRSVVSLDHPHTSWTTTLTHSGVSAASDACKPFDRLPAELVGTVMIQPAHSERHSALLATGRVWKTHVVSSAVPDQVAIAFGADPGRELTWTWRTSAEVASTAIRIRRLPKGVASVPSTEDVDPSPSTAQIIKGESALISVPNLLNDPIIRRHRVTVDGLDPDTVYRYALGDGTPERWGPWQTIKTGPDRSRGARFLYLGDAQTGLENWGRLLKSAYRSHPDTDFLLLAGDLVDRGNERTNWDHFFLRAAGVFDRVPLMPCVGNHEYLDMGPRLYRAFFELPRNGPKRVEPGLAYHFECGDACVAVLDSTLAVTDAGQARRQAEWLDATLRETRATWKFVLFHHPVYPSHPWRDTPTLREQWVPVFDKHHVDLVLQGHDHAYLRTYAMHGNRRVDGPARGTVYVIAVSGDKFVDQAPRDYIEVGHSGLSTYQTIDIDMPAKRLSYRAWTEGGRMIDELTISKSPAARIARAALSPGTP